MIILCVWMFCLNVYLCVICVKCEQRSEEGIDSPPRAGVTVDYESCGCWSPTGASALSHSDIAPALHNSFFLLNFMNIFRKCQVYFLEVLH